MAESQAEIAFDIAIDIETSPGSGVLSHATTGWHTLAEVNTIGPPRGSRDIQESTHMRSPNRTKEFLQGLRDPGEFTANINWIEQDADDEFLTEWDDSGERRKLRIRFPSGKYIAFSTFVTDYGPNLDVGEKKTADLSCKATSAATRGEIA